MPNGEYCMHINISNNISQIIVTHCMDRPVPASSGWWRARSHFWIDVMLYVTHRPERTVVIKVANKWGLIFNAVNCLLYWCSVLLWGDRGAVSCTKRLPFSEKPDPQLQLYFLRLCPRSLSVKTLLLIIYWAVMKWQMIYWEPKTVFQRRTFLSFCTAALPASSNGRGHK